MITEMNNKETVVICFHFSIFEPLETAKVDIKTEGEPL